MNVIINKMKLKVYWFLLVDVGAIGKLVQRFCTIFLNAGDFKFYSEDFSNIHLNSGHLRKKCGKIRQRIFLTN